MNYLLDTNIILIYLRDRKNLKEVEIKIDPFGLGNNPIISIVTVGEIKSIARRNQWGKKKMVLLDELLNSLIITDINSEDVIEAYAEIDAFSQGKLLEKPLGMSARNMGKNDLWIAATASVIQATLLTTDKDFEHLDEVFFQVITVTQKET